MTSSLWLPRLRAVALYSAAWSPLVLVYVVAIAAQEPMPVWAALLSALRSVGVAAALGLFAVAAARRWPWPERLSPGFALGHLLGAAAYGSAWAAGILLLIWRAFGGDLASAVERARSWWAWQAFFGFLVYWVVAGVTWARDAARRARERDRAFLEADALRVRAELSALRGQLDPHFLFNTLHSVAVLTRHDAAAAATALERLADLLRYVLDVQRGARDEVPLADELGFIDAYLALEGLRHGDRLRVVREFEPAALARHVPSLTLQPLVENALRHGIAERAAGGTVTLRGRVDGGTLVLEVADDGAGAAALDPPRGTGIGLRTIRERLRAKFGAAASLDVRTAPGAGFHVTLRLPA